MIQPASVSAYEIAYYVLAILFTIALLYLLYWEFVSNQSLEKLYKWIDSIKWLNFGKRIKTVKSAKKDNDVHPSSETESEVNESHASESQVSENQDDEETIRNDTYWNIWFFNLFWNKINPWLLNPPFRIVTRSSLGCRRSKLYFIS